MTTCLQKCLPEISKHFRVLAWRASDRKSWHHFSLSCHSWRPLFALKVERYCWQIRNFLSAVWKINSSNKILQSMKWNVDLFTEKRYFFEVIRNWKSSIGNLDLKNWFFMSTFTRNSFIAVWKKHSSSIKFYRVPQYCCCWFLIVFCHLELREIKSFKIVPRLALKNAIYCQWKSYFLLQSRNLLKS